jgi:nucleoside-diphosphate-sugar epimerase
MKCLITGVAGFIGSSLSEELIRLGHQVVGIDCFLDYYPRIFKEDNLEALRKSNQFTFVEQSILTADLQELLRGVDVVFHLAAQAGVRASWGKDFEIYTENNIRGTQRMLEACKDISLKKFIYASSSSVYGDVESLPMKETDTLHPVSPYGVSKLAAEHLTYLYWKNFGIPVISLRYFTVFGPRQRPDMAFHKFLAAALMDKPIEMYGTGEQTRDFTYISDIVSAHILAAQSPAQGEVFNIGGGNRITLAAVIPIVEEVSGKKLTIISMPAQKGDARHTYADITKAGEILHFKPKVGVREGLERECAWIKAFLNRKGKENVYR